MSCRLEQANNRNFIFCPDDRTSPADNVRAVVRARVIDEITNQPPRGELTVSSVADGLSPKVGPDGIVGLVGRPGRLHSALDVDGVDIKFSVSAERFLPRHFEETLGPIPGFPEQFQPLDLGIVSFHREPVVLKGRVIQRNGAGSIPLTGVTVSIVGIWQSFPEPSDDVEVVMSPPNIIGINPGLYAEQNAGIASVRRRNLVPVVAENKHLLFPIVKGSRNLLLSNRVNLNVGNILAIDTENEWVTEFVEITAIEPSSNENQPANVTVAVSLAYDHRDETICTRAIPQAPGLNNLFSRQGIPRESTVFLDDLQDFDAATTVEISGGAVNEFHQINRYQTESDDQPGREGFFRLPPISRLAQVRLRAERPDLGDPVDVTMSPDYRYHENHVDFVFS